MGERGPGSLSFDNQQGYKSLGHPEEEQPAIAGTQCVSRGRVQALRGSIGWNGSSSWF